MARGWTWIDENEEITEEQMDTNSPVLDHLAQQWSELHDAEEQRGFRRQAMIEDGDYDGPDYDSEEEMKAAQAIERITREQRAAQIGTIETQMAALGARIMRPYEHWNEDERYMQYMECDRFGDSCY